MTSVKSERTPVEVYFNAFDVPSKRDKIRMLTLPHLCIITAVIIFFNCVGLFGNFSVVFAVYRSSKLRSKAGYLMAVLCILQSVCLMSELANLRIYWGQTAMEQSSCFRLLSVYMFATIAQSLVYFLVVLDMLIAVAFPLKHKMWPDYLYTIAMCTPAMLIAIVALLASYYNMNNEEVKVCRPPNVAHNVVTAITIFLTLTNTAAVVVVLVLLGIVLRSERGLKGSRHRRTNQSIAPSVTSTNQSIAPSVTNKTVRITSGLVAVFVCTWYLSVASMLIAINLSLPEKHLDYIMTLIMIPALIAYSQNFYGLHACPRYAPVLREQTAWLTTCSTKGRGIPAVQTTLKSSSSGIATVTTSIIVRYSLQTILRRQSRNVIFEQAPSKAALAEIFMFKNLLNFEVQGR
ncbi:hypothetical protein Y032_0120g921 [Ancylostoma ceylanicum]|uniref:G-protein coupled receptors family 1 profile domain-containing protein n=1 Tax=Ancylostoma ceylanicum TaxID=53326 RepID=A0A016TAS1_9BILA|nr:hypothetical protein Y032_0120g921 [Ancylostoma ceylanicum]